MTTTDTPGALLLAYADKVARIELAVSDLQALVDSDVPLPAVAEQMIRSTIRTLEVTS